MLKDKLVALAKTLPQRPRSRLVPLPDYADAFIGRHPFGDGSLLDVLTADVRAEERHRGPKRADFKHEQLPPHLLMNLRVVDEHGRQLGESRHLAELKATSARRRARPSRRSRRCACRQRSRGSGRSPTPARRTRRAAAHRRRAAAVAGRQRSAAPRPAATSPPGPSASCPS